MLISWKWMKSNKNSDSFICLCIFLGLQLLFPLTHSNTHTQIWAHIFAITFECTSPNGCHFIIVHSPKYQQIYADSKNGARDHPLRLCTACDLPKLHGERYCVQWVTKVPIISNKMSPNDFFDKEAANETQQETRLISMEMRQNEKVNRRRVRLSRERVNMCSCLYLYACVCVCLRRLHTIRQNVSQRFENLLCFYSNLFWSLCKIGIVKRVLLTNVIKWVTGRKNGFDIARAQIM